jgi:hypothetical protein
MFLPMVDEAFFAVILYISIVYVGVLEQGGVIYVSQMLYNR